MFMDSKHCPRAPGSVPCAAPHRATTEENTDSADRHRPVVDRKQQEE
jgi:hypothetical protein